jgi:hypothetical protein
MVKVTLLVEPTMVVMVVAAVVTGGPPPDGFTETVTAAA